MLEDMTIEILLKLPVKSLLRFKCVCKYWYTLIRSSTFVKKHLHHQSNNARLLVHYYNCSTLEYSFAFFQDKTLATFPLVYYDVDGVVIPNNPNIFGHYDGILGLYDWDSIALWNPATREFRFLPMPNPDIPPRFSVLEHKFGFGLDHTTNDYKVVCIRTYYYSEDYEDYHSAVIVLFHLSTNSWRLFEADLSRVTYVHESSCSTCLNGVYYWLTSVLDKLEFRTTYFYNKILTFDLSNEVFGDIPGPQDIPKLNLGNLILYDESISVMCFDQREVEKYVDIWVMKEEGCWIKELTIGPLVDVGKALGFWKNGELFLETITLKLVLYNPNTQEIKDLQHDGPYDMRKIFVYTESLVSIKEGNEC
ncbi:putative F-box protein At1g32420 [Cornus florida]|uniref:putative F-box protein At1g32420 n=1 Tax=Cornus florida TaxID=4283 RepID=UPI0028A01DAC|nr:putative F-box protein At1g32420 [Cornus florida]